MDKLVTICFCDENKNDLPGEHCVAQPKLKAYVRKNIKFYKYEKSKFIKITGDVCTMYSRVENYLI